MSTASTPNWMKRSRVRSAVCPSSRAAVWIRPASGGEARLVLPLVLAAVDHDAVRPKVDQQRDPGVVGQGGDGRGQLARASRGGDRIERHRPEQGPPVGRLRTLGEQVAGDHIQLVAGGVGEGESVRAVRLLPDRRPRGGHRVRDPTDIDVDPAAQRSRLLQPVERDRRIAAQRIAEPVGADRLIGEQGPPERQQGIGIGRADREPEGLQRRRIRVQAQLPGRRRDRSGQFHLGPGQVGRAGRTDPDPHSARAQVQIGQAGSACGVGQPGDPADQFGAGRLRGSVEPGAHPRPEGPPVSTGLLELTHAQSVHGRSVGPLPDIPLPVPPTRVGRAQK